MSRLELLFHPTDACPYSEDMYGMNPEGLEPEGAFGDDFHLLPEHRARLEAIKRSRILRDYNRGDDNERTKCRSTGR